MFRWHTYPFAIFAAIVLLPVGSAARGAADRNAEHANRGNERTVAVSGTGVDHLTTALVHSQEYTTTGLILRSTEIVELTGDLTGRVLYHVTSVIDFVQGTLVNTGDQVYSGTIKGSAPVMLHDDRFRFEANLNTGAESGDVYLRDHLAGPKVTCTLHVVGTGMTPEGNPSFSYRGECTWRGQ